MLLIMEGVDDRDAVVYDDRGDRDADCGDGGGIVTVVVMAMKQLMMCCRC